MKAGWTKPRIALTVGLLLILGLYVLYPQLVVLFDSFQSTDPAAGAFSQYAFLFQDHNHLVAILNSLWISLASVVLAALIGVPAALLVDRFRFPGRGLIFAGSILPLALPPLIGVIAFCDLIDQTGLLPQWFSALTGASPTWFDLSGIPGLLLVHAYSFSVYFFALSRAGLANLDPTLEFAAGSLGAGLPTRIRRVLLPALMPYLIAAALLTFMTSMSSYSAPQIIGHGTRYMTVAIVNDFHTSPERVPAQAVLLAFFNIGFLLILQLGFGGAWKALAGGSKGSTAPPLRHRFPTIRTAMTFALIAVVFFALMAAPFAAIGLFAAADHPAWNATQEPLTALPDKPAPADGAAPEDGAAAAPLPASSHRSLLPPRYTGANFDLALSSAGYLNAIWISVFATLVAVIGNLILAVVAAWLQVRGSRTLRFFIDFLCMLPMALPGTIIAYNLLVTFVGASPLTFGQVIYNTIAILMLAYFIRQIPLAVRPIVASMARIDPVYERAAQSLGANPATIFWRVILPQLWPGIAAAALLCAVAGLGEYVASVLLAGPATKPISIAIAEEYRSPQRLGQAAALGVVLIVLTALVMGFYAFLTRRRRPA